MVNTVAVRGVAAGFATVAVMTTAQKMARAFTHRPNSFVPAHTLERLLGLPHMPDNQRQRLHSAMHRGRNFLLGIARRLLAERGFRGLFGSFLFTNPRLLNGQALENVTDGGAPP